MAFATSPIEAVTSSDILARFAEVSNTVLDELKALLIRFDILSIISLKEFAKSINSSLVDAFIFTVKSPPAAFSNTSFRFLILFEIPLLRNKDRIAEIIPI
jgi:hypothetical protein